LLNSPPHKKVCKFPDLARSRYRGVDRPKNAVKFMSSGDTFSASGAREGCGKGALGMNCENGHESRIMEKHKLENKELVWKILG
jgi:hypothetical protein